MKISPPFDETKVNVRCAVARVALVPSGLDSCQELMPITQRCGMWVAKLENAYLLHPNCNLGQESLVSVEVPGENRDVGDARGWSQRPRPLTNARLRDGGHGHVAPLLGQSRERRLAEQHGLVVGVHGRQDGGAEVGAALALLGDL